MVLLLHGLFGAGSNLASIARHLNPSYRTVRVDLRNHGRSPHTDAMSYPLMAMDIVRLLDSQGIACCAVLGHSMGGMLAYAALEHFDQRLFKSVVTVGSPAFTAVKHPLMDKLYKLRFLLKVVPWLPSRRLAQLGSLAPQLIHRSLGKIVANPDTMDSNHIRQLLRKAITDLPAPLLEQFAEWYGGPPGFKRHDGLLDYYAQMSRIQVPMLIIAGTGDLLTPVEDLRSVYESIGSKDKSLLLCGKAQGFSADYGHVDLILGVNARREIYPHIADWIESH